MSALATDKKTKYFTKSSNYRPVVVATEARKKHMHREKKAEVQQKLKKNTTIEYQHNTDNGGQAMGEELIHAQMST